MDKGNQSSPDSSAANPSASKNLPNSSTSDEDAFSIKKISSLKFSFQIVLTVCVLALCFQGMIDEDKDNNTLYWGGITGLVSGWMPSPNGLKGVAKSDAK